MRHLPVRLAWFALVFALTGCGDDEYGILIRAYGSTPSALLEGTSVRVTVRDLQNGTRSEPVEETLQQGACTPDDNGDGCTAPLPPDHVRIAIELSRPGQFSVHLSATGADGTFVATRCYTVVGLTKSDVLLMGPILAADDADGDGWTALETCRERGLEEPGCRDMCPDQWGLDCDDEDAGRNPGAVEKCQDGTDQDCDGVDATCADNDGDTYDGCPPDAPNCCTPGPDTTCEPEQPACVDTTTCDCDDTNADVNPGVQETSNPDDGRCDNSVDENCDGVLQPCDNDGDGVLPCGAGITGNCDCDDDPETGPGVYPGAPETPGGECDGVDNNCNGLTDEVEQCLSDDLDGDGSTVGDDCNDCAASMSPLEDTTICDDRIDQDCSIGGTNDGLRLPPNADPCPAGDGDGDGYVGQAAGGTDCDDANPERYPGAPDRCGDAVDDDCSGQASDCGSDADGDDYNAANDCDDSTTDPAPDQPGPWGADVHPGAADPCDGVDNDCDGVVDEDVAEGSGCILGADARWVVIDFQSDLQHCGSCRHNCNPGCADGTLCKADGCTSGGCTCGADDDPACDGSDSDYCCPDGCQDLTTDPINCGRCGWVCEAPACQVPVCRGGNCDTSNMADGTPCGGGNYCCDGQCVGECAPGSTSSQGCGDCGTQSRDCSAACTWGAWGACQGQGICSIGNTETRACGDCGDQDRICQGNCSWGSWGICYGQGECTPGTTSSQGCGDCGTQSRTCQDDCSWGGYGSCGGEGVCTPSQTETRACGNCGSQTRTCLGNCTWGTWTACSGEGVCAPGASSSRACGNCGTQSRSCLDTCTWGAYDACSGEGVCNPADPNRQVDCNVCGTQEQDCSAACQWVNVGSCDNVPGRACADPGTCQYATCNSSGNCVTVNETDGTDPGSECDGNAGRDVCCGGTCTECCGASTSSCGSQPTCQDWTCSGNSCVAVDETDGTDPETECAGNGGRDICCGGACTECCGGSTASCGSAPVCQDWTCSGNNCVAVNETDGTDPETECPGNGGLAICCGGGCAECCGSTSSCGAEPVCQDWSCTDSNCVASDETNGTDPETECPGNGGRAICCNGGCQECCGASTSSCGPEPLCADWSCNGGTCTPVYETNGTDPETECPGGSNNCNGAGACTG